MWRAETWLLAIGAHDVQCAPARTPSRAERRPILVPFDDSADPAESARSADAALRRAVNDALKPLHGRRVRLRVLVSDRWLALATIPWGDALASGNPRVRDAFAREQLRATGLDVSHDDSLRVDDRSPFGEPRIAVAYPAALITYLRGAAASIGARLESVQPLEVAAADVARAQVGRPLRALALLDGERLRLMHVDAGCWTAGAARHDAALRRDAATLLPALWARQQLREPALAGIDRLHVLALGADWDAPVAMGSGHEPVRWRTTSAAVSPELRASRAARRASSLDAIGSAPRHRVFFSAATALCVVVTALVAGQAYRIGTAAQAQEAALRRLSAQPARPAAPNWSREELARVQAVNAAIRELNLPIGAVLRAVQPPRDIRVALLGIDVDPGRNAAAASVKLEAESASGAEMARYVGYLSERPPLAQAWLRSHLIDDADPARRYRFTVDVTWRD